MFDALPKLAADKRHSAVARGAHDADVHAHPHHLPLQAAAGVLLLQCDHIAQVNVQDFRHSLVLVC